MDSVVASAVERLRTDAKQAAYRHNPVAWARDVLDVHLWSKQCEVAESVRDHKRTVVASAHGTGKSHGGGVLACWWVAVHPPGQAIVISCYTDDTEVLTRRGWKLFQDVCTGPDGDEFATRNPATHAFEWQHAFEYHEAPFDGEVVDFRARNTHLRVTPNHRMLVEWSEYANGMRHSGEFFKRADAVSHRGARLPALSAWEGKTPETVTFGRYTWDAQDFAAFLGAWLAEGSLGPRVKYTKKGGYGGSVAGDVSEGAGSIQLTQLPGTKGYEPYQKLLERMLGRRPAQSSGKTWVFSCKELYEYLEKLGKSHTKYIPAEVKDWGRQALDQLLEYYLLGDGWFQRSQVQGAAEDQGSWRSCTVSRALADDLQEVAQKVGKYATISTRQPRDGGTFPGGRQIRAENCRIGYYLIFSSTRCREVTPSRSYYKGKVYCVSVPNESLYVRRGGSPVWCGNTAPTGPQVSAILWEEIRSNHAKAAARGMPLPGYVTMGNEWKLDSGRLVGIGRKPADGDQHAFQGIHRPFVLVLVDEAAGVPEELWTGVEAITTTANSRILAIGNPDDRETTFGEVFCEDRYKRMWNRIRIPASSTPNFTGEPVPEPLNDVLVQVSWVQDRLTAWGDEDPRYQSKVEAKFPENGILGLFGPQVLASGFDSAGVPALGPLVLGVDPARYGNDRTAVVARRGRLAWVEESWMGMDTQGSAKRVIAIAERLRARGEDGVPVECGVEVRVDVIGLGAGVVDRLAEESAKKEYSWFSVREVNGAAAPPQEQGGSVQSYGNARAYFYDQSKQQMAAGLLKVLPHALLEDELSGVRIRYTSAKMYIESKEEMRRRGAKSPDFADALIYASAPIPDVLEVGDVVQTSAEQAASELEMLYTQIAEQLELEISPL